MRDFSLCFELIGKQTDLRGIYSDQFAELGNKGGKKQPLKKEGKKSARGTTFRREKEGEKQGKEGSSGIKREAVGKKGEAVGKKGKQCKKRGKGSREKKREKEGKRGKQR